MSGEADLADYAKRMDGALEVLRKDLQGLRTGRASASLLEPVMVEAYGSEVPLTQIGTVNVPESRMLTVQVWDKGLVKAVEKAIRAAGLGLNPAADGTLVRVPLPELTADRRAELVKVGHKYAEQARVAVRNVRRDAMDSLKKQEKDGEVSQDEQKARAELIQTLTDRHIASINELLAAKERDIVTV